MPKKKKRFKIAEIVMLIFLVIRFLVSLVTSFSKFPKFFLIGAVLSMFYLFGFYSVWKRKKYALNIIIAIVILSILTGVLGGRNFSVFVGGIILILLAIWYARETKNA